MRRGSEQVFSMTVDNPNTACGPVSTYILAFGTFPIYDELLQDETRKLDLPGSRPGTFAVLHMHIRAQVDVTRRNKSILNNLLVFLSGDGQPLKIYSNSWVLAEIGQMALSIIQQLVING